MVFHVFKQFITLPNLRVFWQVINARNRKIHSINSMIQNGVQKIVFFKGKLHCHRSLITIVGFIEFSNRFHENFFAYKCIIVNWFIMWSVPVPLRKLVQPQYQYIPEILPYSSRKRHSQHQGRPQTVY